MNDIYAREFWRFVVVQQEVAKLDMTAVDYPPMQDPASFNLDAVKRQIEAVIKNKPGNKSNLALQWVARKGRPLFCADG